MDNELKQYLHAGKKNLIAVYILYLCGVVVPVFIVIGAVLSYINRDINDNFLRSHYIFTIRTFVIAIVTSVVALLANFFFIGMIFYIFIYLWFITRVVFGLKYLANNLPHPNSLTLWVK